MKKENQFVFAVAIGGAIGTAIGVVTHNLGLWLSLGTAIGAGIGTTLMRNNYDDTSKKE